MRCLVFAPFLVACLVPACAADSSSSSDDEAAAGSSALTDYDRQNVYDEVKGDAHAPGDLLKSNLTDQKLVDAVGWLMEHDPPSFYITAIRSDHHNDGQAAHAGGHALDMYARNGDQARKLIQILAQDPYVYEIGLGGAYKAYRSEVRGNKKYFDDNSATHVHIGVIHAFGR